MRISPFLCNKQASAGVEVSRITTGAFPIARSFTKPGPRAQTRSVHVHPFAELWPVLNQSLVCHFDENILVGKIAFDGKQSGVRELLDGFLSRRSLFGQ